MDSTNKSSRPGTTSKILRYNLLLFQKCKPKSSNEIKIQNILKHNLYDIQTNFAPYNKNKSEKFKKYESLKMLAW